MQRNTQQTNKKRLLAAVLVAAAGTIVYSNFVAAPVQAAGNGPTYTSDGQLVMPKNYRDWVFIGATVTPNALNGGKAGFPEFHNVYVEASKLAAYRKTGTFPEGTILVKELTLLRNSTHPDGSADEASGRGFFEGQFNGLDVTVKDSKKYAKTGNWGFFNFGHHALPYAANAKEASKEECAGCHMAGAAKTDLTWVQFYPIMTAKN
jgi:hypothetical protein